MGGERSSTTRMRESGQICCACKKFLDRLPWSGGERYCDICAQQRTRHSVYMYFMNVSGGWFCQFLEPDLKTSLARELTFSSPDKIREMWERFGSKKGQVDNQALEYAINQGRGSIWLSLTHDQYSKLKK
jgi:hypothetical protein